MTNQPTSGNNVVMTVTAEQLTQMIAAALASLQPAPQVQQPSRVKWEPDEQVVSVSSNRKPGKPETSEKDNPMNTTLINNRKHANPTILAALANAKPREHKDAYLKNVFMDPAVAPELEYVSQEGKNDEDFLSALRVIADPDDDNFTVIRDVNAVKGAATGISDAFSKGAYGVLLIGAHIKDELGWLRTQKSMDKPVGYVSSESDGLVYDGQGNRMPIANLPKEGWAPVFWNGTALKAVAPYTIDYVMDYGTDRDKKAKDAFNHAIEVFWKHEMIDFVLKGINLELWLSSVTRGYVTTVLQAWGQDRKTVIEIANKVQADSKRSKRFYQEAKKLQDSGMDFGDLNTKTLTLLDGKGSIAVSDLQPGDYVCAFSTGKNHTLENRHFLTGAEYDAAFLQNIVRNGYLVTVDRG